MGLREQIDTLVYKWCKEHAPDLTAAKAWYSDGGIYDYIELLVKAAEGETP